MVLKINTLQGLSKMVDMQVCSDNTSDGKYQNYVCSTSASLRGKCKGLLGLSAELLDFGFSC